MAMISIDLDAMGALVKALDKAATDAPRAAGTLATKLDDVLLSYPGLSRWRTGGQAVVRIESLAESCRWRLAKAQELYDSDPSIGRVVGVDEDALVAEDARRAAELISGIEYDQLNDIPQELLDLLRRNENDPEFAKKFAAELDPLDAAFMLMLINNHVSPVGNDIPAAQRPEYMRRYQELLERLGGTLSLGASVMNPDDQAAFNKKWADAFLEPTAGTPLALLVSRGQWSDEFLTGVKKSIDKVEDDFVSSWSYFLFRNGDPRVDAWSGHGAPLMIDPEVDPETGEHPEISDPMYGVLRAAMYNPQWMLDNFAGGPLTESFQYDSADQQDLTGQVDTRIKEFFDRNPDQATMSWFIQSVLSAEAASIQASGGTSGLLDDVQKWVGNYARLDRIEEAKPWLERWGHQLLDVISLVPMLGEVSDGVNAVWYYAEGDTVNGTLSVVNVFLPSVIGGAVHGVKWLKNADNAAELAELLVKSSRIVDVVNPRVANRLETVTFDLQRSANFDSALATRTTEAANRAVVLANRDRIIEQLNDLGFSLSRADLDSKAGIDAALKRLSRQGSPEAQKLYADLQNITTAERASLSAQKAASEQLGDVAAQDVLIAQRSNVIPGLSGPRGRDTFDVVGLSPDRSALTIVEAKGGTANLSTKGRELPDGTRAAQGSPAYFEDVWRVDKDLQAWLAKNPDIASGIKDGSITVNYQLVHADAAGNISITTLALTDDVLKNLSLP